MFNCRESVLPVFGLFSGLVTPMGLLSRYIFLDELGNFLHCLPLIKSVIGFELIFLNKV